MKVFVKTLKGTHFEIQVNPEDTVADVKKNIETIQGLDVYPAVQQMLVHQGKVLKDETTLDENKVAENSFIVIMLKKSKSSPGQVSTTTSAPPTSKAQASGVLPPATPATTVPHAPVAALAQPPAAAPTPAPNPAPSPVPPVAALSTSDVYGQAASGRVAGNNLEGAVQQILDMGGGAWNRDTVIRALQAAFNNPERAVEYLCSGIPEQTEAPTLSRPPEAGLSTNPTAQSTQPPQPAPIPSGGPNASPLDLFPQGLPNADTTAAGAGTLDFLRNSQQFRALQAVVQANPQILQPMLQELGKQNPHLMRHIQEHQSDFLRMINEPAEGGDGNVLGQLGEAMPQAVTVTAEEREAIERLEAMGFDRALVLEVFFACNKNEELAANYLLDHMHEFDE